MKEKIGANVSKNKVQLMKKGGHTKTMKDQLEELKSLNIFMKDVTC